MRRLGLLSFCAMFWAAGAPSAGAQEADELPLQGLNRRELRLLEPHLDRGPVLMALFRQDERQAPPIVLAARVEAPAQRVAEIIAEPTEYPQFMPALDSIAVSSRSGSQIAYDWTWRVALFTLRGSNVMTVYRGNPRRGYRIEVRATGGDLGRGRLSWRVLPDGPNRSLVVLTSRVDMRDANYLADQLAAGGMAVFRSINIALATVMVFGTRRRAEGGPRSSSGELGVLSRPPIDPNALQPLANRGDLVFLELQGEELARVSVLARMASNEERTRAVMRDPEEFGQSLMHGSRAHVVQRTDEFVDFSWEIPLPLVGVSGRMRMTPTEDVIGVAGLSGSLRSGRWEFDTHVFPSGEAAVIGWGRFDPRETSRLLRRLIADDTDFAHGLAMAAQVMVARSLRSRVLRYQP